MVAECAYAESRHCTGLMTMTTILDSIRDLQNRTGKSESECLENVEAAENFWQTLPRGDHFELQHTLCSALARVSSSGKPDIDRFRALRALDRRMHGPLGEMLSEYAALGRQSPELAGRLWDATFELSRAFAHEYSYLMRFLRDIVPGDAWLEHVPEIIVRLFRHREIELYLTLCRYAAWPRERWKFLHDIYAFALSMKVSQCDVLMYHLADKTAVSVTPEQVYLRVLLLQVVAGGQFVQSEMAFARRVIARCSASLALGAVSAETGSVALKSGFVVDLGSSEALMRSPIATGGVVLRLDTTPLANAIDGEHAALQLLAAAQGSNATTIARQIAILSKLKIACAPQRVRIRRRGERAAVALRSVQATIGGLPSIFNTLCDDAHRAGRLDHAKEPHVDATTVIEPPEYRDAAVAPRSDDAELAFPRPATFKAPQAVWQMRDGSDSGCRLRGRGSGAQRLMTGCLVAFRDDAATPWTVAVVRRLKKLVGKNVELGAEYVGRNPQRVVLLTDSARGNAEVSTAGQDRFAALYLPESIAQPKVPIKTLLMPACEFAAGRLLTMLSASRESRIRLKKPLEHQIDFVWTSFEFIGSGSLASDSQPSLEGYRSKGE